LARIERLGRRDYAEVWALQRELVAQRVKDEVEDTILICEHVSVYTVGRRRDALKNLVNVENTPVYEIERGGDVTWHGPGQVVAYPVVRTDDILKHLRRLEEVMICATRAVCGLELERDPRNAGVWHQGKKVGSVGVASRQGVSWHGLALNINPDLSWFWRINPCGLESSLLSSLEAESGRKINRDDVEEEISRIFMDW
jgi:lipoyl(octanoyl) transferase